MTWQAGQRDVAEPTGAAITGNIAAGGAHVHIDISFRLVEWPWAEKGPLSLIPQPSEVTARCGDRALSLGFAIPAPEHVITPPSHSSTKKVRYTLTLSTQALVALEAQRDGGSLEFAMVLVALPLFVAEYPDCAPGIDVRPTSVSYSFKVPKEQWTAVLQHVGYCDTIVTELQLPTTGPESTAAGRRRLVQAVRARNEGSYAETMRGCRLALDELENAGFGGKAPRDVVHFLAERARTLSPSERFSALKVAVQVFLSPAHHANAPDEHYSREDAELAIAMTAALLRLAPSRGNKSEDEA